MLILTGLTCVTAGREGTICRRLPWLHSEARVGRVTKGEDGRPNRCYTCNDINLSTAGGVRR